MNAVTPFAALLACRNQLSHPVAEELSRLFIEEHLSRLARRLAEFHISGVPVSLPLPHFAAECTPPLATAWEPFLAAMQLWQAVENNAAGEVVTAFARALEAAGTKSILVLLGQRLTPASLTDARGFPPTTDELLQVAAQLHSPNDPLSVAARALSKHVHRSAGEFWGEVTGSVATKNARAASLLQAILRDATWWNVFGHFQHEFVFEARVASGQGARWDLQPLEFIGFLEPFDEELCPSLQSDRESC